MRGITIIFVGTLDGGFRSLLAEATVERRMYFVVLDHFCDRMTEYIDTLAPDDPITIVLQEVSTYVYHLCRDSDSSSLLSDDDDE